MVTLITTIQEITLQAEAFGVYKYLFFEKNMSRDEILNLFEKWGREFDEYEKKHVNEPDWYYYDEIDSFVLDKKARIMA